MVSPEISPSIAFMRIRRNRRVAIISTKTDITVNKVLTMSLAIMRSITEINWVRFTNDLSKRWIFILSFVDWLYFPYTVKKV